MTKIILRTIFFYFFIVLAYRLMGKREVGQLGIIDLIVSILIAELVAISIENYQESLLLTVFPVLVLVGLEIGLGFFGLKSRRFNKMMGGKPTIIIDKGKLIYKNLITQRYSIDDLLLELRQKSIYSIEDVEYALLETNGRLSIFKRTPLSNFSSVPLPVIIEGQVQYNVLNNLKKDETWLQNSLKNANISLDEVFYCLYKNAHLYIIKYK